MFNQQRNLNTRVNKCFQQHIKTLQPKITITETQIKFIPQAKYIISIKVCCGISELQNACNQTCSLLGFNCDNGQTKNTKLINSYQKSSKFKNESLKTKRNSPLANQLRQKQINLLQIVNDSKKAKHINLLRIETHMGPGGREGKSLGSLA